MIRSVVSLAGIVVLLIPVTLRASDNTSRSRDEVVREIQQLLEDGHHAEAEERATEALKVFPRDAGLYALVGVVEAEKGNYQGAQSDFLKAIALDNHLAGAYLNLGRLYQQNAAADHEALHKALTIYGKLLRFDPGNTEANYQSAFLLERQKAFQASLDHLSRLPAAEQERAQALSVRCGDLAGLGQHAQAAATAERLLASPDLTEADILAVLPALDSPRDGDVREALLEGAVKRQVAGFDTLSALGRVYERKGRLPEARSTLESAARARPQSVETLMELARVADRQSDYKGALGYLAHARDLDPKNPAIHFFFGMVCIEESLIQEAYRSLKEAVSLAPDRASYNYAMGIVAQRRADPGEAVPYFKKYCALKPQDPRGKLALGMTYFYAHEHESARNELRSAAQYRKTAAPAHFFLGRIANQEGNYSEALEELQQALNAQPHYADPFAEEGIIYMKQKDYRAAEGALRRALSIDPDHYAANLTLAMLYQRTGDPRAAEQAARLEEVKKKRAEHEKLTLRSIEIVR